MARVSDLAGFDSHVEVIPVISPPLRQSGEFEEEVCSVLAHASMSVYVCVCVCVTFCQMQGT